MGNALCSDSAVTVESVLCSYSADREFLPDTEGKMEMGDGDGE